MGSLIVRSSLPVGKSQKDSSGNSVQKSSGVSIVNTSSRSLDIIRGSKAVSEKRPRMVLAMDATASREPVWDIAKDLMDVICQALPGELDVALAVHSGGRMERYTAFTSKASQLRDEVASVSCHPGLTKLIPLMRRTLDFDGVKTMVYIGDVMEEDVEEAMIVCEKMRLRGIKLVVLHDKTIMDMKVAQAEKIFASMTKKTNGCVLEFDMSSIQKLKEILQALVVVSVKGRAVYQDEKLKRLPSMQLLLTHMKT